jgi:hypothetical protein
MMKTSNKTIWLIALLILFAYAAPLSAQNENLEESGETETIIEETETDKFQEAEEELEQIEDEYRELFKQEEATEETVTEPAEAPQESYTSEPTYETETTVSGFNLGIEPFRLSQLRPVKLANDDFAAIVFSRTMRTPVAALENPSNLAVASQTRWGVTLPLPLPVPSMGISVQNSSFDLGTYNTYFNDGRLLSAEELDNFVNLFKDGLNFQTELEFPSLLSVRFPLFVGTVFFNSGLYVKPLGTLPGEVLAMPFTGLQFNEPIQGDDLYFDVYAYLKNTVGFGTRYQLGRIGEFRAGFSINTYTGSFAMIDTDELTLLSTPDYIQVKGNVTGILVDPENDDYGNIPQITPGVDFGFGYKTRLKDLIPVHLPEYFVNDLDFQLSFYDMGATLSSGNMLKKQFSIDGTIDDLMDLTEKDVDIDSMLNIEETTLDSNFVQTEELAGKMKIMLTWQPIGRVMVQAGMTNFLNEGLGYEADPRMHLSATVFPLKWLMLNVGLDTIGGEGRSTYGFGFTTRFWDFAIYTHANGLGEKLRGGGFTLVNNLYF